VHFSDRVAEARQCVEISSPPQLRRVPGRYSSCMSRGRRLVIAVCFFLFLGAIAEVVARLGLALTGAKTGGFAALRLGKQRVAAGELDSQSAGADAARLLTEGISLHPFLGYVQTPRPVGPQWLELHHLPINDLGFIDDKSSLQKRSPQRRIVAIAGGSVAFFFGSEGTQHLRERLAALPDFAGREIVFVRLALGGFKQPQQLATLGYLLALGGEFDYLINLDGFNEVALHPVEGRPIGANPAYPRSWPRLVEAAAAPDRLRALGAQAFWTDRRTHWAALLSGPILDRSGLAALTWKVGDRWLIGHIETAKAAFRALSQGERLSFSALGPRVEPADDAAMFAALAAIWEHSSLQLANLCRANGIEYFHFLQPNQYVEGSKPLGAEERKVAIDPDSPYAASIVAGYPLLRAGGSRLAAAGVHFADLTHLFSGVDAPVYKDSCCHLNLDGNRRLAEAIAGHVAEGAEGAEGAAAAAAAAETSQGTAASHPK